MDIIPNRLLYYNKNKHYNSDPYGQFIFKQAKEWSELMEQGIENENITSFTDIVEYLRENATRLSLETSCCKGGLTGFQQDVATRLLIKAWKYGFELWVGLLLEKKDNDLFIREENIQWVVSYLNGDYDRLLNYKQELDYKTNMKL